LTEEELVEALFRKLPAKIKVPNFKSDGDELRLFGRDGFLNMWLGEDA
jgi:hypothetical protein